MLAIGPSHSPFSIGHSMLVIGHSVAVSPACRRTEDGGQRAEDGGQRAEDGGLRSVADCRYNVAWASCPCSSRRTDEVTRAASPDSPFMPHAHFLDELALPRRRPKIRLLHLNDSLHNLHAGPRPYVRRHEPATLFPVSSHFCVQRWAFSVERSSLPLILLGHSMLDIGYSHPPRRTEKTTSPPRVPPHGRARPPSPRQNRLWRTPGMPASVRLSGV